MPVKDDRVTVDVREEVRAGGEPFSKIMKAVAALRPGEDLLLIAPFEPVPLFRVMAAQGFSHASTPTASGDWEVLFARNGGESLSPSQVQSSAQGSRGCAPISTDTVEVDTRGLEPPEPLVRILETVATLPEGAAIRAHTNRRPMHLYPELEERGFSGETEEQADGSFITHIRRR